MSGSGKSTFARSHFAPTEIVSSDACRALVSDDENDQRATSGAFALVHAIAAERLRFGRLAVIDATNVQTEARRPLIQLARAHHVLPIAVVIDPSERVCHERNELRTDRTLPAHVLRNQSKALRRSFPSRKEGFHSVIVLKGSDADDVRFVRQRLWTDRRHEHGPFDVIGDVHGCFDELVALLERLGWSISGDRDSASHPDGRVAVFVGDLVDRGPATPAVLRLVMNMVDAGRAVCVPGNHENKLLRALRGNDVRLTHGLAQSMEQLAVETDDFRARVMAFIDGLVSHYVMDDGRLVVAHAGLREEMHGRASGVVRSFALYGDTTGETDEYGLPVRYAWADEYRGSAAVVYGHTPVPEARWVNNTICIDTGCVFGGALTALRWPERELVGVPAARTYYEPVRPLVTTEPDDRDPLELELGDVTGTRRIDTSLNGTVTIREDQSAAALEVMSRFAEDPRWLVYLPPTMAPPATSSLPGLLEHPAEAFAQYRALGVRHLVCEEKHMGSRAVVIVGRDAAAVERRFRINDELAGTILTRTGRAFFGDRTWAGAVLSNVRDAVSAAGLWDELSTDWLVLDCELLPWSAKARDLLLRQYAAVGAAATASLDHAREVITSASERLGDDHAMQLLAARVGARASAAAAFVDAYRRYCWDVDTPGDVELAPFQVLAAEGEVLARRSNLWHLEVADRLCSVDPATFRRTRRATVDLDDETSVAAATAWWTAMTEEGGEGMVVKPVEPVSRSSRGLVQPGVKVRGREYLRIIYGPEYTEPGNLDRLRERGLGHKRSLALREFALGIEALDRFVAGEPLHRIHECTFGVLALESDPIDPRL